LEKPEKNHETDEEGTENNHDEHHHDDEHDDHDHGLYDPHTWISPFIAKQQAETIYNALIQRDPANEEYYTQRWNQLQQKFLTTDDAYKEQLATKQKNVIIVTHAAFGYLADRYGFHQHGVIGLSADEQPSASTIAALVNTMIDQEIYVVYVDPVYSDSYAQTLKNTLESKINQSVQILRLYLMSGEIDGLDYFTQLERNLQNLKIGLQAS
jgi:zinc transport system substrate-binding protein